MSFQNIINNHKFIFYFILTTLSAVLMSLPWTFGWGVFVFFGFVPLLFVEHRCKTQRMFFLLTTYYVILWHLLTVLWISNAATVGLVASTALNIVLWNVALQSYSFARRYRRKSLAYVLLVSGFLAVEYLNIANTEISWPWLVLGNAFAMTPDMVQWYEYTGVLGGSLWVLLVSAFALEAIISRKRLFGVISLLLFGIPMILSYWIKSNLVISDTQKLKVAVVQPNFDPYGEKFSMGKNAQLKIIDSLLSDLPNDLDYIILPETAIDYEYDEKYIEFDPIIIRFKELLQNNYPQCDMIIGAMTYKIYPKSAERPSQTARLMSSGAYYDMSNSSLLINPKRDVEIYRKTKLVIGAEMLPFNNVLSVLGDLSLKLGGTSGVLFPEGSPKIFSHSVDSVSLGAAICYESVYGGYFSQFASKGAELMTVITNDGWWGDTYGYKQHFSFSSLRSIETRKWICRSANTGISALINPKGEVVQSLGWWKRGVLIGEVQSNNFHTFYMIYGDYLGSISSFAFVIMLLYTLSLGYKKKLLFDE